MITRKYQQKKVHEKAAATRGSSLFKKNLTKYGNGGIMFDVGETPLWWNWQTQGT